METEKRSSGRVGVGELKGKVEERVEKGGSSQGGGLRRREWRRRDIMQLEL